MRRLVSLAFLLGALLALLAPSAGASSGPDVVWDGQVWNHVYERQTPLHDASVDRYVEVALGYWHARGVQPCRPHLYVAPGLGGALGAAEPRGKGYVVGCNLWVLDEYAHPSASVWEQAATCHIVIHEMGHLGGKGHSASGIMYPEYDGTSFARRSHGRLAGFDFCTKYVARRYNARLARR